MQGLDNNAITHTDTVKTFIAKLELWHGCVQEDTTMQFHRYSEVIVTVNDDTICCRMKRYISEHLENLIDEFIVFFNQTSLNCFIVNTICLQIPMP